MPDERPDPAEEDIWAGDRRLSRPDSSLPDWYTPDVIYRPIPIAWFAGALVLQCIAMPVVFMIMHGRGPAAIVMASALVTGAIGWITWQRGIGDAALGWRIATITMLAGFLGLNCVVALS